MVNREERYLFDCLDSNPTFGELKKNGVNTLLQNIPKNKRKVFVDLGSGNGTVLKYVNLLDSTFEKIIGIELSQERYHYSFQNLKKQKRIQLFCGDLLNFDIKNTNVIYISNLCFNHSFNQILSKKIDREAQENTLVFVSQKLELKRDYVMTKIIVEQSWDKKSILFKYELF